MFRQKSALGVLNIERDWLYLDQAFDRSPTLPGYSSEMSMKRVLLTEAAHHTYVTDAAAKAAEAEVLEMVIEFVLRRYPTRFAMVDAHTEAGGSSPAIATLSDGYEHTFILSDFADEPLKLAGMLVQEDMYLLQEQDLPSEEEEHPPFPAGKNLVEGFQVRSPKLTVAFPQSSYISMTYRVVGAVRRARSR